MIFWLWVQRETADPSSSRVPSNSFSDCATRPTAAHSLARAALIREAAMAKNMAPKRAAKANRRKAVLAQRRKAELLTTPLIEKVRRAAQAPIQYCLLSEGLLE